MDLDLAKMDEIVFGGRTETRGRAQKPGLEVSIVRSLGVEDIPALEFGQQLVPTAKQPGPSQLKHAHHQVARLMAEGRPLVEISLISGYTPEYLGQLKQGLDFQELMKYYDSQRDAIFVDTVERMKSLGITTLNKLQSQLEDDANVWTKRELMEMAELMLLKPQQQRPGGGSGASAPGVSISVKFVSAAAQPELIDITPEADGEEG